MTRKQLEQTKAISAQILDRDLNCPEAEDHNRAHGWQIDGDVIHATAHMVRLAYWHAARPRMYPL